MIDDTAAWEPEHLRLRVGDRVRVRLSGECRLPPRYGDGGLLFDGQLHDQAEDGRVARIESIDEPGTAMDVHCYWVTFEVPWVADDNVTVRHMAYARSELERLPDG